MRPVRMEGLFLWDFGDGYSEHMPHETPVEEKYLLSIRADNLILRFHVHSKGLQGALGASKILFLHFGP